MRKAFTLIELLIVVAIIAILAAIALPNFLEAQTRSKVSRCKSDMRSLASALEAYYVDWNSYTRRAGGADPDNPQGWQMLTTPVAYITSVPQDPFGLARRPADNALRGMLYELGVGALGIGNAGTPTNPGVGFPSDTYYVAGYGPDKLDDTVAKGNANPPTQWTWNAASYPWEDAAQVNTAAGAAEAVGLVYDPTNGTISRGDLLRFGGVKPAGLVYDVLYGIASK